MAPTQPTSSSTKPRRRKQANWPLLAGSLTGGIEISITYPIEYCKTVMQLHPGRYKGPIDAARVNVGAHGVGVLYRGLPSWLLFRFPASAVRFTVFGQLSRALEGQLGQADTEWSQLRRDVAAGIGAGIVESFTCLTPCQNLSIKMMHDSERPKGRQKYPRFFPGCRAIFREFGFKGMFAGAVPTIVKGSINQSIRFPVFHLLNGRLKERRGEGGAESLSGSFIEPLACGAIAGGISAVASHPVDVVKSNLMGLDAARFKSSTLRCAKHILRNHGVGGFYVGLAPRITRVCLEVGLLFSLFENINHMLDVVYGKVANSGGG